jgi:hypothetical protein
MTALVALSGHNCYRCLDISLVFRVRYTLWKV